MATTTLAAGMLMPRTLGSWPSIDAMVDDALELLRGEVGGAGDRHSGETPEPLPQSPVPAPNPQPERNDQ
jgi:hypothetical protein